MKKLSFIINPIAGTNLRTVTEKQIIKHFPAHEYQVEIHKTIRPGHAIDIAKQLVNNTDIVVIAGGDGTVNEVGSVLRGSETKMGILPVGSGNGLAHHLKIPLNVDKALQVIKKANAVKIDIGIAHCETFGEKCFFSNCGFGFDSETIHAYDDTKMRGFFTYLVMLLKSFFTLHPNRVRIQFKDFDKYLHPFVFTVANSSQYGYKITAVPGASIVDGYLDTLLIPDTKLMRILRYAFYSLSNANQEVKKVAEFYQAQEIVVDFEQSTKFQIDGEPYLVNNRLKISVDHQSLPVIVTSID